MPLHQRPLDGPYFEELAVGQTFQAPSRTLSDEIA
jgi:hypothetical protein